MKMHEFFMIENKLRFSVSKNPLIASDLLLVDYVIGLGSHFEKLNSAWHKCRFQLVKVKLHAIIYKIFGARQFIGDFSFNVWLLSDRIGLRRHFLQKNMKNYNLLWAKRKIQNIFITFNVFGVEKFIGDVKFAVRRPHDQIRRHFFVGKYENTIIYL